MAEPTAQLGVGILEVGKPDIHEPLELADRVQALVAARVVDNRYRKPARTRRGKCLRQQVCPVCGSHQVDVERTLVLKFEHDLGKPVRCNLKTKVAGRDLVVLAVDALERAPAKEHGPRTRLARDGRLLPKVKGSARELERRPRTAYADLAGRTVGAAAARTEFAGGKGSGVKQRCCHLRSSSIRCEA